MTRTPTLLMLALFLAATGCGSGGLAGGGRGPQTDVTPESLAPTVRRMQGVDRELLWKAARDYVKGHFPTREEDEQQRIVETQTVEWEENRTLYRTHITVQVAPDPRDVEHVQLGVVAQLIQPAYLFEEGAAGPVNVDRWKLVGSHTDLEEFIAARIVERYMLLEQGRNPDELESQRPIIKAAESGN